MLYIAAWQYYIIPMDSRCASQKSVNIRKIKNKSTFMVKAFKFQSLVIFFISKLYAFGNPYNVILSSYNKSHLKYLEVGKCTDK